MKRHASMSRIYRLVWIQVLNAWVVVAESAREKRMGNGRKFVVAAMTLSTALVQAAPIGGQVTAGTGNITQLGATTTISQVSQNLSLTWQSFNIAPQETVNFRQPGASAIAVNRIFDTNGTQILGHLNANGQVFLINPNGILFGRGAQVNVGGLVASTLDLNDTILNGNTRIFSGNGKGSVLNQGSINAANGGYVALLGNRVSNQGTIVAQLGTIALGAGSAETLTFSGNQLVHVRVDQSTLNNLAENGLLIRADGGQVVMTAGAKDALLASAVNNSGAIEARTVENRNGTIILLAGMQAGQVNVGGTLDASASNGGNGGFIETSAAHIKVADNTKVTTAALRGGSGTWLIDPQDFTISATATGSITGGIPSGDIWGNTLSTALGSGSVTILSSQGSTAGSGDVNVNAPVSWSANTLTLTAAHDININAVMTASGTSSLIMNTATANGLDAIVAGGAVKVGMNAAGFTGRVDFFQVDGVTPRGGTGFLTINGLGYIVIDSLGASTTTTVTDLQGLKSGLASNYALGTNIDATGTSFWNAGTGFVPIGTPGTPFMGRFDGLGHTVTALTIKPGSASAGLFGATGPNLTFQNVGLVGGSVLGAAGSGGLIGTNGTGSLVSNSYNTGNVTGAAGTGGLVGDNTTGAISNSFSTGNVSGANGTGGLIGTNTTGAISNNYATGSVTGSNAGTGGLVGSNTTGAVSKSYATGGVTGGGAATGGLLGSTQANTVSDSYATGNVSGAGAGVGGLIGTSIGTVATSYSTGSVSGTGSQLGALVGGTAGTVSTSFWNSDTSLVATSVGGGLGMTTAQIKTQANFTSATAANGNVNPNWNFANTWVMYEGLTYPLLRPFMMPLAVTANNDTKTYNGVAYSGGNGVTYSTTPNSTLLGAVSYSGTSQGAINANSYVITPGGLSSNQSGYIISYTNGALTINPAPLAIAANNASKVYGAGLPALGVTYSGFVNGDTATSLTTPASAATTASAASPVGTYATSASGAVDGNYNFSYASGSLTINPAPLSYTAAPATFFTGQTLSPLSGSVTGFVTGDNMSNSTTGSLVWTTAAVSASPPGRYPVDGGGLAASNYFFSQTPGNTTALTMKVLPPVIVFHDPAAAILSTLATLLSSPNSLDVAGGYGGNGGFGNNAPQGNNYVNIDIMNAYRGNPVSLLMLHIMNGGIRLPSNFCEASGANDANDNNLRVQLCTPR